MHNLDQAFQEGKSKLRKLKIPIAQNIVIKPSSRMSRSYGNCHMTADGYEIHISDRLLDDSSPRKALLTTICHELIHTCPGCLNHGDLWKHYSQIASKSLHMPIARTNDPKELGLNPEKWAQLSSPAKKEEDYRYVLICKNCGKRYYYKRMSKTLRNASRYRCGECRGMLEACQLKR